MKNLIKIIRKCNSVPTQVSNLILFRVEVDFKFSTRTY